jgi:hypothetical protein
MIISVLGWTAAIIGITDVAAKPSGPVIGGKHFVRDLDPTIEDMQPGETAYTTSWAFCLGYKITDTPFGTSCTPIRRTVDGFDFIGKPGDLVYDIKEDDLMN